MVSPNEQWLVMVGRFLTAYSAESVFIVWSLLMISIVFEVFAAMVSCWYVIWLVIDNAFKV